MPNADVERTIANFMRDVEHLAREGAPVDFTGEAHMALLHLYDKGWRVVRVNGMENDKVMGYVEQWTP